MGCGVMHAVLQRKRKRICKGKKRKKVNPQNIFCANDLPPPPPPPTPK